MASRSCPSARRVGEGAEHQHDDQGRDVAAAAKAADAGALAVVPQLRGGVAGDQPDVVVRAGVDAVEAGSAIHVARLARKKQVQLAAGNAITATDTVLRLA